MNVYEKPQEKFCDYQQAVEFFHNKGYTSLPTLHLMTYKYKGKKCSDPVWVCQEANITPQVLPIFDFPQSKKDKLCKADFSEPIEDGLIYAHNNALYMAVDTSEGLSFRKLNVIYNIAIAEVFAKLIYKGDTVERDYILSSIKVLDENQTEHCEYYWIGYPNDGNLNDQGEIENFDSSKVLAVPVFYLDTHKQDLDTTDFEIEMLESSDFFVSRETLWKVIETLEFGTQINAEKEFSSVQKELKS